MKDEVLVVGPGGVKLGAAVGVRLGAAVGVRLSPPSSSFEQSDSQLTSKPYPSHRAHAVAASSSEQSSAHVSSPSWRHATEQSLTHAGKP